MSAEMNEDLLLELEAALDGFPKFRGILPANYPRGKRFGISKETIRQYSDDRACRFWHQLNLPLALHAWLKILLT